jgi:TraM recognition site of TraD and TraG
MSTGDGVGLDDRIKAKGTVYLGRRMNLVQRQEVTSPVGGGGFVTGRPSGGFMPGVDDPFAGVSGTQIRAERLVWGFTGTDEPVTMEDNGLTTSYGIFGAPRSGKTHLLKLILRQLFDLKTKQPEKRFGGLILDPKAELIADMRQAIDDAGRTDDLIVISAEELADGPGVNPIDTAFDPYELGRMLVLAAQSAGTGASEPFWFGAWKNLFGAAIYLMQMHSLKVLTLRDLLDAVLVMEPGGDLLAAGSPERGIQRIAREVREELAGLGEDERQDANRAINQVEQFYRQEPDNIETVNTLIINAYSAFQQSRFRCFSPDEDAAADRVSFYDQIIDEGKLVLVSVSPDDPGLAKVLCTLIKCLFQATVLSRQSRVRAGTLKNYVRPTMLVADEVSQVASEIPGESMGDGNFCSLARQNGCFVLFVTQSVNVLEATSLKEHWKSIFSNFGAKIFMRLADNETTEEATKLIGDMDWQMTSYGTSQGGDGGSASTNTDLRERKFPSSVFTQLVERRHAVVVGSLDGNNSQPGTWFVEIPEQVPPKSDWKKKDEDGA